jgi:hypothetical protein
MFYSHRDVEILINNKKMITNSMEISQSVDISHPIFQGESISSRNVVESPIVGSLRLSYYLTGLDPLKDYIYSNSNYPLSGNICGMTFNNGYLGSYSLSAEANNPIEINIEIPFFDELVGTFSPIISSGISNMKTLNFNDSYFTYSNYSTTDLTNNSITSFQWNYKANIEPVYYAAQSDVTNLSPDRVSINNKDISAQITCDSNVIPLSFMGEPFAIDLKCPHPTNSNLYESYACSGLINQRNFSLDSNSLSKTTFGVSQSHLNSTPLIGAVITYTYPSLGNTIQVLSSNTNPNGFLSNNENIHLIERVKIGDTYVPFSITDGAIYDTLNATITNETINGYLTLETMKGIVQYPVPLDLAFANPIVSTISPTTGISHTQVTINGSNFYRITDILFNGVKANFNLIQNTGATHRIIAYVPENASIGKVSVVSSLRDSSGTSSQTFYPQIKVDGFSPTTGIWGTTVTISGKNFSGVNGVYFGAAAAASYNVISNNLLTAVTPPPAPFYSDPYSFTKGKITVKSSLGLSGSSNNKFRPLYPITGLSVISGSPDEDMFIKVLNTDVHHLCNVGGSYKVAFGNQSSNFTIMGYPYVNTFSGKIPAGFIGNDYISFYEPDGVTKYPGFTGKFYGIGPAPIIGYNTSQNGQLNPKISPNNFNLFSTNTLTIGGSNMKDFFGLANYLVISGYGNEFKFSDIKVSQLNDTVQVNNVRITGIPDVNTGYYTVYLKNFAGTGNFVNSGVLITSPARLIPNSSFSFGQGASAYANQRIVLTPYMSDNQYSINPYDTFYSLYNTIWWYYGQVWGGGNPNNEQIHWNGPNVIADLYALGDAQNLSYFTDNNKRELNYFTVYNYTGDYNYANVTRKAKSEVAYSSKTGIYEILIGDSFGAAIGSSSSQPYRTSDNQYVYQTGLIVFSTGGSSISLPSKVDNFIGIRIKNADILNSWALELYTDPYPNSLSVLRYNPLHITEIKMY